MLHDSICDVKDSKDLQPNNVTIQLPSQNRGIGLCDSSCPLQPHSTNIPKCHKRTKRAPSIPGSIHTISATHIIAWSSTCHIASHRFISLDTNCRRAMQAIEQSSYSYSTNVTYLSRPSICTRRGHGADPGGIHPGRRHRWRTWRILARASGHAASCRSTLCHRSSTWCPCPAAASCSSRFVHQTLPDRRTGRRSTSSLPFQLRWMTKKTQKISPPALMTMMLMTTRR
mmetsp:Transcript_10297/g.28281  ORF Transcript_10297/g.28281 Transcript_10297/m.28281 type:complete len:228 (+) Transcript_10297:1126-1809(+)